MKRTATPKQRVSLSLGTFVAAQAIMGISHEGMIGTIIALGIGYAGWSFADEIFSKVQPEDGEGAIPLPSGSSGRKHGLAARLLTTREQRMANQIPEGPEQEREELQGDDDDFSIFHASEPFVFSLLLANGWRPTSDQIFLARLDDGTNVFASIAQIVHIALAGATRRGKTSIIRQLLAQLCYIKTPCILLDPHYTPYDVETNEDWSPFTEHLLVNPMECKSYDKIEEVLRDTVTIVLEKRKALRTQMKPVGNHLFIIIDEYPAILAEKPAVQNFVSKLLREGGKYKIHLVVASQDFQVKTISPQAGGAIRACYNTTFYVGGDSTTARVLLNADIEKSVESLLGKGPIYLRCETHKQASLAHTPWMDNEAVYELAGESLLSDEDIDEIQDSTDGDNDGEMATLGTNQQTQKTAENSPESPQEAMPIAEKPNKRRMADQIDLKAAVALWNSGYNSRRKLAAILDIAPNQASKLMEAMGVKDETE